MPSITPLVPCATKEKCRRKISVWRRSGDVNKLEFVEHHSGGYCSFTDEAII
jgi:hypothetical protein